jgi:hypothetical protein
LSCPGVSKPPTCAFSLSSAGVSCPHFHVGGSFANRSVDGVVKELIIFMLVYNLIRAAMVLAAERQGVDPNRMSFTDAMRRLRSCCSQPPTPQPIDLNANPPRPGRWHPRVLKRRMNPYDLMNRPRNEYAKPSLAEEVAA